MGKLPETQSQQQRFVINREERTRGRHAATLASYAVLCHACSGSAAAATAGRQCPRLRLVAIISAKFTSYVNQWGPERASAATCFCPGGDITAELGRRPELPRDVCSFRSSGSSIGQERPKLPRFPSNFIS